MPTTRAVIWSREEDMTHDVYRPAALARFSATMDASGNVLAYDNKSAGGSVTHQVLQRTFGLPGSGPDKTTAEGEFDMPYEFPNQRISHVIGPTPVPLGYWRSVGHSHNAFFKGNDILVHKVTCAVDCGIAVNPNIIAQQLESAVVFGLSAALFGEVTIKDGKVEQQNFHNYPVLRMNQARKSRPSSSRVRSRRRAWADRARRRSRQPLRTRCLY